MPKVYLINQLDFRIASMKTLTFLLFGILSIRLLKSEPVKLHFKVNFITLTFFVENTD